MIEFSFQTIMKQIGANVVYDPATNTMTATKGNNKLSHKIGTNVMDVNGEIIKWDVPSRIVNNRTLVPLHAISEALGGTVMYGVTGNAMTIIISI